MATPCEATVCATATLPGEIRPETVRGVAGFFRAACAVDGRWWLLDPGDRAFFCRGVHGVSESGAEADADRVPGDGPAARLRRWGFNTVGCGGGRAWRSGGLARLATVEFCAAGALVQAHGVRLPDVFDRDWPAQARERAAAVCPTGAEDRELLGWVTDLTTGWAQPGDDPADRPTLLQVCLSLEPGCAAYHAAWEFVLALHGGRLAAVGQAWGLPLANKEVVREATRAGRGLATRGYLRDHTRWTREFARRYFTTTAAAIRAADPNHLVLGARCGRPVGAAVTGACVPPAVDVALLDWRDLPPVPAAAHATGAAAAMPVLAGDFCWADRKLLSPAAAGRWHELTSVERMLRRGRAAFARVARHPAACGYLWPQWRDEPGEQPPFARGLVHDNGAEAREHTELLADLNARAEALRRATPTIFPP
ncbi:MAG: hypothetical protein HZA93_07205 [Verrucomicrobia bacterium]|nr:hypothetical protein [Verrucomicrobiota bacterium]